MSLTTKRIFLAIVSAMLALCVAFAVVTFVANGSNPAYAQGNEKTVVEWVGKPSSNEMVNNGDGTITANEVYSAQKIVDGKNFNPVKNIVKKSLVITTMQDYSGGNTGINFGTFWNSWTSPTTDETRLGPRVHLFGDCIRVGNGWGFNSASTKSYYLKNNPYAEGVNYGNTTDRYKLQEGVPYTVYFGITNKFDGTTLTGWDIYLKITSIDGTATYIDYTFENITATSKVKDKVTQDMAENDMFVYLGSGATRSISSSMRFSEYGSSSSKTLYLDELEKDADISEYWLINGISNNRIGKKVEENAKNYTGNNAFCTPDFDNRFTFKLSVNDEYGYFSSEKLTRTSDNKSFNAGSLRITLGQRYKDYTFIFNFYTNKITLNQGALSVNGGKSAIPSVAVDYDLDPAKEYKVSIAVRDVRDAEGNLVYRLQTLDVAEIGNEENKIHVERFSDMLVPYPEGVDTEGNKIVDSIWNGENYLPMHFRLANYDDGVNTISASNLCATGDGCEAWIYSYDGPQKYVYINSETPHVLNSAKIELPAVTEAGFVGYVCENDGELYQPGIVDMSDCVDAHIKFNAKFVTIVKIKDAAGNLITSAEVEGSSYTLPVYDGEKSVVAYKNESGIFKAGETVAINGDTTFIRYEADVQILDEVAIRLSDDEFGGIRFGIKILTNDYAVLQSANIPFAIKIDGENAQPVSQDQDGAYTIIYIAKTDIELANLNTDIDAEIVVSYTSASEVVLSKTANMCTIASDLNNRNQLAIANGQALYNREDAQKLQKYLSALED